MAGSKARAAADKQGSDSSDRRALHAFLSDEAHDSWHRVASELGISVSGMLEAMAPELAKDPDESALGDRVDVLVRQARKIDADRRRR